MELGHLNGKVPKLEHLVRLLVASAGLAGWEEIRQVDKLRRKMELERGVAERDYRKRVAAKRAAGEERKRLAKQDELVKKAKEVRRYQEESARLRSEQHAVGEAGYARKYPNSTPIFLVRTQSP